MKKIFYFNYDVGSAIEYCGNMFKNFILETTRFSDCELIEQKEQDGATVQFSNLMKHQPDIIIVNEKYSKTIEAVLFYKIQKPETKVLMLLHVWKDLESLNANFNSDAPGINDKAKFSEFLNKCVDYIFVLNSKPDNDFSRYAEVKHKIVNMYYPTDPAIFNIKKDFSVRPNKFVYVGNLIPVKFSEEFVEKIKETDIQIDCYGRYNYDGKINKYESYIEKIKNTKNLVLKGLAPQDEVANILNEYKYFVLPHNGYEPFNWTLLQSIFCGTIPLVLNNRDTNTFDYTWNDWAKGFMLETSDVDVYIENLKEINKNSEDIENELKENSNLISKSAMEKFNYEKLKSKFSELLMNLIKNEVLYETMAEEKRENILELPSEKRRCSAHNTGYNSADNTSYNTSVDATNDSGVLDYN